MTPLYLHNDNNDQKIDKNISSATISSRKQVMLWSALSSVRLNLLTHLELHVSHCTRVSTIQVKVSWEINTVRVLLHIHRLQQNVYYEIIVTLWTRGTRAGRGTTHRHARELGMQVTWQTAARHCDVRTSDCVASLVFSSLPFSSLPYPQSHLMFPYWQFPFTADAHANAFHCSRSKVGSEVREWKQGKGKWKIGLAESRVIGVTRPLFGCALCHAAERQNKM